MKIQKNVLRYNGIYWIRIGFYGKYVMIFGYGPLAWALGTLGPTFGYGPLAWALRTLGP